MLLPAVNKFLCCKVKVAFHPVQYLYLKLVVNDPKVMVNDILLCFARRFSSLSVV